MLGFLGILAILYLIACPLSLLVMMLIEGGQLDGILSFKAGRVVAAAATIVVLSALLVLITCSFVYATIRHTFFGDTRKEFEDAYDEMVWSFKDAWRTITVDIPRGVNSEDYFR